MDSIRSLHQVVLNLFKTKTNNQPSSANRKLIGEENGFRIQKDTFRYNFSFWDDTTIVKVNAWHKLQQKVTYWKIKAKFVQHDGYDNWFLEVEGEAIDLQFRLDKCSCRIDVLNTLGEIVTTHRGNMIGPFHDKFNFKNVFNMRELYAKDPNLYHLQFFPVPCDTILLAVTIGPSKRQKRERAYKPVKRMLDEGILTDMVIKTQKTEFPCHKFILATYSEYFRAMFRINMKENQKNIVNWVEVFDSETVKDLLHFLYTGQTPPNVQVTYPTLVEAANLCLLDELKDICSETMIKILDVKNAGSILEIAEKFDLENLRNKAIFFVIEHYNEVLDSPGFQEISSEIKTSLLERVIEIRANYVQTNITKESKGAQRRRHR